MVEEWSGVRANECERERERGGKGETEREREREYIYLDEDGFQCAIS